MGTENGNPDDYRALRTAMAAVIVDVDFLFFKTSSGNDLPAILRHFVSCFSRAISESR